MYGIEVTLSNGTTAYGVIFPDKSIYVHEPIVDTWASPDDMRHDARISHYEVIGPIIPLEQMKDYLREDYHKALNVIDDERERLKQRYRDAEKSIHELALSSTITVMLDEKEIASIKVA